MPTSIRILLFWTFVTGFLVAAPLLIFYTFGFRYNFQTGRVEHTGVISVSTIPRGANVSVNGKPHRSVTPTLVKQLRPRDHLVSLTKDGFHSWEKTVRAVERKTVFLDSIVLWANRKPVLVTDQGNIHLMNKASTALASLEVTGAWTEVWIEELEKNTRALVARFPGSQPEKVGLSWAPNGERLLMSSGASDTLVSKRDGSEQLRLNERVPSIQSAWWNEGEAEDLIVTIGSETRRLNPVSGEVSMLFNTPVETLFGREGRLFFTREGAERTHVVSRVGAEENVIAILPTGSYRFIESRLPYLLLFEEGRGRIVLIDADNHDQPILLQTEALEAHWSPNGETRLLYTNGFETHLFYPQTLGDTLIDRMSRSVASVAWHPSGTAIVLAHQDGVVAYDLHEPGFIQTKLNDAQEISRVFIESPGGRLLFLGTVDGVYGLYQQTIR
ncbi:TPA: hypothetical protein DDZ10_04495 [Candidatus Uhrbacteria bacterium]|nr:MAG: hypothetical protein UY79_C0005G0038 [Parcubacteria group bacterium GW2011_GWA2_53_21]OGL72010.1 MAG: hypothetical protein A3D69_00710 [Candidatus Uhrbacteria bacterium RIFCSPHIGHO2_02_FULL_54_11]HBL39894.1 hypothetical protein [Candidatus Uhrbacteria bacterium]